MGVGEKRREKKNQTSTNDLILNSRDDSAESSRTGAKPSPWTQRVFRYKHRVDALKSIQAIADGFSLRFLWGAKNTEGDYFYAVCFKKRMVI